MTKRAQIGKLFCARIDDSPQRAVTRDNDKIVGILRRVPNRQFGSLSRIQAPGPNHNALRTGPNLSASFRTSDTTGNPVSRQINRVLDDVNWNCGVNDIPYG
ncbi:hypothetical protein [Microbacterium sp.]|uniref:hypothetical protein n=1 Tax=Microbacterium sp. TaxID=51671 RepID=UPI003241F20D